MNEITAWARLNAELNLIDIKIVSYIKENKLILDISLDMCILLSDIATVDCLQHIHYVISFLHNALTRLCW